MESIFIFGRLPGLKISGEILERRDMKSPESMQRCSGLICYLWRLEIDLDGWEILTQGELRRRRMRSADFKIAQDVRRDQNRRQQ